LSAPAAIAGAGGAGIAAVPDDDGAEAAPPPEPAETMASRISSVTPAFLRLTSESVLRSNFEGVDLILAITTAAGSPPLTIWITESLVSTSWAIEMAPGSDRLTASTRTRARTTRIIFMRRPPGRRESIRTGRAHPGARADRSTTLGYFKRSVNSAPRPARRARGHAAGSMASSAIVPFRAMAPATPMPPARKPIQRDPVGWVPMQAERMPMARPRLASGAESSTRVLCIAANPD